MRSILLFSLLIVTLGAHAQSGWFSQLMEDRQKHNEELKTEADSPIPDSLRANFTGLRYFDPSNNFLTTAEFVRLKKPKTIWFATSNGKEKEYIHFAELRFQLLGKSYVLAAYYSPSVRQREGFSKHVFVPFKDLTNRVETYGGGRYLDLTEPEGNSIELDFNRAYNPYCAYADGYSCPKVPEENYLNLRIEAGEKTLYTE